MESHKDDWKWQFAHRITSTRVGKASLGAVYTYLGKEGDWYKIQYTTTTVAYVYGTFVTLS